MAYVAFHTRALKDIQDAAAIKAVTVVSVESFNGAIKDIMVEDGVIGEYVFYSVAEFVPVVTKKDA